MKFWLALIFAVSAVFVILAVGIINGTRMGVILYRAFISAVCLGSMGVLLAVVYEHKILPYLAQKILSREEAKTDEGEVAAEEAADAKEDDTQDDNKDIQEETSDFAPFTTDNFKRVSPPNS